MFSRAMFGSWEVNFDQGRFYHTDRKYCRLCFVYPDIVRVSLIRTSGGISVEQEIGKCVSRSSKLGLVAFSPCSSAS